MRFALEKLPKMIRPDLGPETELDLWAAAVFGAKVSIIGGVASAAVAIFLQLLNRAVFGAKRDLYDEVGTGNVMSGAV
jgi:hypothetical protein